MIFAKKGEIFTAQANAVTGLVGTIVVSVVDSNGDIIIPQHTTNIVENPIRNYVATLTAPLTSARYRIIWDVDDEHPGASEELVVNAFGIPITALVSEIVERVLQRDPDLDETVVTQIAVWVVGKVKNTQDVFDASLTATLDELEGMTLLTLARSYLSLSGPATSEESYTAGLVSQKASSGRSLQSFQSLVRWLIDEANKLLGWNWSVVMLLEDIDPIGIGTSTGINWDQSRLALTINFE